MTDQRAGRPARLPDDAQAAGEHRRPVPGDRPGRRAGRTPGFDPIAKVDLDATGRRRTGPQALVAASRMPTPRARSTCPRWSPAMPRATPVPTSDAPVVSPVAQKAHGWSSTRRPGHGVWLDGKPVTLSATDEGQGREPRSAEARPARGSRRRSLIRVPAGRTLGGSGHAGHHDRRRPAGAGSPRDGEPMQARDP